MNNVTVIIPAYNEATRIAYVIDVVKAATLSQDILVVDDGSTDNTAAVAEAQGVRVLRLPENVGKGTALRRGAVNARGDILLFLDADLRGMTPEYVDALIRPMLTQRAEMTIGVFHGGRAATDLAQWISPNISGQRCLAREFFLSVPLVEGSRSGVEIAITTYARACKLAITQVALPGATHTMKEEKLGLLRGTIARYRMYFDIILTLVRYHLLMRTLSKSAVRSE